MPGTVADRAAPHATPAGLAVPDRLLVALSSATGIYEAICFPTFGKVFTAVPAIVFAAVIAVAPAVPKPRDPSLDQHPPARHQDHVTPSHQVGREAR